MPGFAAGRGARTRVTTDLFLTASRLDAATLARTVPPSCLRTIDAAGARRRDGDDTLLDCGPWAPRRPAVHLLPAFSPLAASHLPDALLRALTTRMPFVWSWCSFITRRNHRWLLARTYSDSVTPASRLSLPAHTTYWKA